MRRVVTGCFGAWGVLRDLRPDGSDFPRNRTSRHLDHRALRRPRRARDGSALPLRPPPRAEAGIVLAGLLGAHARADPGGTLPLVHEVRRLLPARKRCARPRTARPLILGVAAGTRKSTFGGSRPTCRSTGGGSPSSSPGSTGSCPCFSWAGGSFSSGACSASPPAPATPP